MWSKFVEMANPYEALKSSVKTQEYTHTQKHKDVGRLRWLFMTKWQKLMYAMPIFHRNKHRLHLGNGYCLNFETMTTDVEIL